MAIQYLTGKRATAFRKGRDGRKIDSIVIHHWGEPSKYAGLSSLQGIGKVEAFFAQGGKNTSAHYVVSGGYVLPMVSENDTAYHAGDWERNTRSIGIECDPRCRPEDLDTVVELVNELRKAHGNLQAYAHSDIIATACPGRYIPYMGIISAAASSTAFNKTPQGPTVNTKLIVDGYWGSATTRRLQRVLGTTVDGVVSSQSSVNRAANPGLTTGWEWVIPSQAKGSIVIRAVQRKCGVTADGLIGPITIRALQKRLGTVQDGSISAPSQAVKALQNRLNNGTF
ncbi:hypothetical protein DRB06_07740 [Actinomyces sp. Z5]|uniref:peptidoglycan recognition protein family protein n=1 Tax=Actinomyces sp. Z5 TaxID=2250216 RepID=UPI000DCEB44B|nr:peptidoglycan recognition family protein [Actinomyces sp. Z5]RAX20900.1 hypothetical protein DRB06_07740 [Actinomyces sp. Z5]